MQITAAQVIVCSPGRNFVTLKLTTAAGLAGWGDATLNGRELAVASYLRDHVVPLLTGRDARRIEDTWQLLYRGAYWRRGPVTMAAIAAVDMALWDLLAQSLSVPLYRLLGGACRDAVRVYAHASGETVEAALAAVAALQAQGYRAIRVQCRVPGVADAYGVGHAGGPHGPAQYAPAQYAPAQYEPAQPGALQEAVWETGPYLRFVPELFARVRREFGPAIDLLHDAHHRLTPIEAARLGKALEPFHLLWLEDPVPAELPGGYRLIRQHTTTPLAVGEAFNSIHDCRELITRQWIDYIRASAVHAGGISHLRKIAQLAELYHVRTGCHGATDLSPIAMAAALHFGLSVPNFGIQERMLHSAETDRVFLHAYRYQDGAMHPGDAPGLGVSLDETLAAQYPYRPAYLPIARLRDGTMHNW